MTRQTEISMLRELAKSVEWRDQSEAARRRAQYRCQRCKAPETQRRQLGILRRISDEAWLDLPNQQAEPRARVHPPRWRHPDTGRIIETIETGAGSKYRPTVPTRAERIILTTFISPGGEVVALCQRCQFSKKGAAPKTRNRTTAPEEAHHAANRFRAVLRSAMHDVEMDENDLAAALKTDRKAIRDCLADDIPLDFALVVRICNAMGYSPRLVLTPSPLEEPHHDTHYE